ncbi:MAG: bifunctional nuclease family protein [Flavobacteriales bacterium]|jgi:bifunctional DNase/RNase|nr:bifunctional nuclease family protein [Flavobacteriales bacterium]MDG1440989.1 bifunctional nuclease family protein [Flavobacteriales bacterium]MDG1798776.1 bifunctional nuclease family protein [Flavobacteriales bacterium]
MEKIKLDIAGLSYSQTQSGAYALVLSEVIGKRRLPIIIGGFEAQAIAIELEKMTPSRPLTHDLFKNFADNFKINLVEVIIYNLVEGIFFAKLICELDGKEVEIDSRTSDAIALAVRFESPIYTYEFVLNSAGIILDDEELSENDDITPEINLEDITNDPAERLTLKELKKQLKNSIENEDYEAASRFRDEINKRKEN